MIQSPVFGLALVTEPSKCSTKGSGQARESERDEKKKKKKMKKMKKKDMGILPAEANFPRIITPVSETIVNGSIKYYVACHQTIDLCDMHLTTRDMIFYFFET
ncbi:hypothetical protein COCSADRAFT_24258 [Bipolaris sorokiniana ND90Pr]|uniref:Uncharacterized protein n=1 Tax=Cochliobolus sativus (strain ND90Pr / ATCC 201652) TaxID=665912 RepID=M2TB85_COCSN|nr:uncharacterized protein COCSADRAFT_24258 [Bipolaris sorokiniana ND90Pr]EMD66122.1 hypothetical protein COCSADRAFT_24258 [Bipolaris sorokiniana ND90Pr]